MSWICAALVFLFSSSDFSSSKIFLPPASPENELVAEKGDGMNKEEVQGELQNNQEPAKNQPPQGAQPGAGDSNQKTPPSGILPDGRGYPYGEVQYALAGPVGLKIQTGVNLLTPEWQTTFPNGGEQDLDFRELEVWDTRFSVVFPFLGFYFEGGLTLGGVVDGKIENYNRVGGTTTKYRASVEGLSLGVSAFLFRQLGSSNLFLKMGIEYTNLKFYADTVKDSEAIAPGPNNSVAGLDSWYQFEWLEAKIGMYYLPGNLLSGMFMGIDLVPGLWFFGKGRDRHTDSRFETGTTDIYGKAGFGASGLVGYQVQIGPKQRIVFGLEWKYLKVTNGYYKRTTTTYYRRSRMEADMGGVWFFLRYETAF